MSTTTMPSLLTETPYAYLTEVENNVFELFLTVRLSKGYTINRDSAPIYQNGLTKLLFKATKDDTSTKAVYCRERIQLKPAEVAIRNNYSFHKQFELLIEIETTLSNGYVDTRKNTIIYEDADNAKPKKGIKTAFNAPYIYLNNPQDLQAANIGFNPRCIMFSTGSIKQDITISNGNCILKINVDENSNNRILADERLECNLVEYNDAGIIDGSFDVEITLNPLQNGTQLKSSTTRKGRRRNKSSDSNQSPFRD